MDNQNNTNNLPEQLFRLLGLMHRYQALNFRTFGPMGTPLRGQGRVLLLLKMQPAISQKELAYLLDMRQQSLSELLAKLERSGYITRTPSEEDKRITLISLTEEGRKAADEVQAQKKDLCGMFDALNEEEQQQFAGYLQRIIESLQKEIDASGEADPNFGGFWARGQHQRPFGGFDGRSGTVQWGFGCQPQFNPEEDKEN